MTDNTSTPSDEAAQNATLQKAVIVGMQPGQARRVIDEAARFARLLRVPVGTVKRRLHDGRQRLASDVRGEI